MNDEIPLFEISWDKEDLKNVIDSVGRGGYWAKGPYVSEFEERLEEYFGVDHALVVNSGTTAIQCALQGHGIGPGDEVIVPGFTFIATANAVSMVGAKPVFADISRETYGLDPNGVREQITSDTAAILPVHVYGASCQIEELKQIAEENDLALVEDAAEAMGATYRGEMVGTFGDSAALSFCQNKIITTGEGGAILTDDPKVAHQVDLVRNHGRDSADYFESADSGNYVQPGSNYRMADALAALGCSQIEKIDSLIKGRRSAANYLSERISQIGGVTPPTDPDWGRHVYQLYTVTLDRDIDRKVVIETLDQEGIPSKIYWTPPLPETECYGVKESQTLPVATEISNRVLSLPIHPELSETTAQRIADTLSVAVAAARQKE